LLLLTISFNGLGEEPVKSLLLLNERNGAAEYLRVVVRQVNALPTFHTDKRISPRDAQQRLILLGTARWTAHRQFEDRTCVDHAETHRRKPYSKTARSRLSGSPSKEAKDGLSHFVDPVQPLIRHGKA
jgi:hypothetical protein